MREVEKLSLKRNKVLGLVILSIITLTLMVSIMEILFTSFLIATMHGYSSPFVIKEVGEGSTHFIGNLINLALLGAPISLAIAYSIKGAMEKRQKGSHYIVIIVIVIPIIVIMTLILAGIAAGIAACWYCSSNVCPGKVESCGATWLNVYCNCYP